MKDTCEGIPVYLDANAVLRYILKDIEEQFEVVNRCIKNRYCVVSLETISEVAYVLDGLYNVPRVLVIQMFRKLSTEMVVYNMDVFLRALEVYDQSPKLDFVDCLMYGYHIARGAEILTFDKKLKSRLEKS